MRIHILRALCACALIWSLLAAGASAAFISYTGGGLDDDWLTNANWSSNSPPTSADSVAIQIGTKPVNVSQPGAEGRWIDVRNNGLLSISGGELTVGANSGWLWVGFLSTGTVRQSGGMVRSTGNNTDLVIDQYGTYEMTGGSLDLADDIWMRGGSQMIVRGSPTIKMGNDFRVPVNQTASLTVDLIGNQSPMFAIGDDMNLFGDLNIAIDTSMWTGGTSIDLFQVGDRLRGQIAAVTVNGVPLNPADYQFPSQPGTITIPVNEPSSLAFTSLALAFVLGRSRRGQLQRPSRGMPVPHGMGMQARAKSHSRHARLISRA